MEIPKEWKRMEKTQKCKSPGIDKVPNFWLNIF